MEIKSYAKINLTLDIYPKQDNGYHPIKTVFQKISLHDLISIKAAPAGSGLLFDCNIPELLTDPRNSVIKAHQILCSYFDSEMDIKIHLQKNIPPMSGLGGGSSNAATTLLALNQWFELGLDEVELAAIGAQVGMDVPFFLIDSPCALGARYGDIVMPLDSLPSFGVFICMPKMGISTSKAYHAIDHYPMSMNAELTDSFLEWLVSDTKHDLQTMQSFLHNDFTSLLKDDFSALKKMFQNIQEIAPEINQDDIHITGSGSAVYCIFELKQLPSWQQRSNELQEKHGYFTHAGYSLFQAHEARLKSH